MERDLTQGKIASSLLRFAAPMIAGNLLQQCYNLADTFIVGRCIGADALAAVGSSFTLMVFLTSILLGLCMGSGAVFSICYGAREEDKLKNSIFVSFVLIGIIAVVIQTVVLGALDPILRMLQIPHEIFKETKEYLQVVCWGIFFTYLYNYFASLLRALGNSVVPLVFLAVSAAVNIVLDFVFILWFSMGVAGAALATVIAQGISAAGMMIYSVKVLPQLKLNKQHMRFDKMILDQVMKYSLLTCVQQSVMNFGILMVQGLINSFGVAVMAAFAAANKIDAFAYMPMQDFGNAFSTFIAQNYGAKKQHRISQGIKRAALMAIGAGIVISALVFVFAKPLLTLFIDPSEQEILSIGVQYLHIEGACYWGIGVLFLFYGLFRGMGCPGISVVLTVISLGTRVLLAYGLAAIPAFGLLGVWWSVPIGWVLADLSGLLFWKKSKDKIIQLDSMEM
ncbi:MAG: MATE family efflux transporter [Massiliimalia sp.]|jgi:putative MATE family efflux protein